MPNPLKCDSQGNFAEVQCNSEFCYCVESVSGIEKHNSRIPLGRLPNCQGFFNIHIVLLMILGDRSPQKACSVLNCRIKDCPHRKFEVNNDGCSTCKCENPCANITCPRGKICVLMQMDCFDKFHCSLQSRC